MTAQGSEPGDIWSRELLMRQAFDDEHRRIEEQAPIYDGMVAEYEARHRAGAESYPTPPLVKLLAWSCLLAAVVLILVAVFA